MANNRVAALKGNARLQETSKLGVQPSSKPGKTAPRLIQDLLSYDPRKLHFSGRNVLTDPAPHYQNDGQLPMVVVTGSCRHKYMTKQDQSHLPRFDSKPDKSTLLASSHAQTRSILSIISSTFLKAQVVDGNLPIYLKVSVGRISNGSSALRRVVLPPSRIKERADIVMKMAPERFEGIAHPLPINVLMNLRSYLNNALRNPGAKKIASLNKKFVTSFGDYGQPCRELLEYLGFTYDSGECSWTPPNPKINPTLPLEEPLNILLDDVEKELMVLISQRPGDEQRVANIQSFPLPSLKDVERSLGSLDYEKTHASRTIDLTAEAHPYYASLGATSEFSDPLLIFSYERQTSCDPDNAPYYLECLQDLAKGRESELLETKAVLMESEGQISRKDIHNAYRYFGMDPRSRELDDDTIIGNFRSRVGDAPRQETEMRRALGIIGLNRKSVKIQFEAANSVTNYEQALTWLGADKDTSDEFIVSMYTLKVNEDHNEREVARNAVSLIAGKRNSEALRSWLATGELGEVEMDVGHAYNRLGIEDRTLDDDMILTTYEIRVSEAPSQLQDLRMALKAIAKSKDSRRIGGFLNTGLLSSEHALSGWPVGLENIGNTCYLNSLLQFYFTVKPLRDLIFDFDKYKMPLDAESLGRKQVGSRRVTVKEVVRAQKFAFELQKLFQSMIAATTSAVTPEQELARLTLISSNNEENIRRMSLLTSKRPSLGDINGMPVLGPLGPPPPGQEKRNGAANYAVGEHEMDIDTEPQQGAVNEATNMDGSYDGDTSSEATLVEPLTNEENDFMIIDSGVKEQQQQIMEDKENLPPQKADVPRPSTPDMYHAPLGESSPSKANEQHRLLSTAKEDSDTMSDTVMINGAPPTPPSEGPPNRPPPVPPRPKAEEPVSTVQDEVELGAQQDVTEVVGNVLFQLQCAITPVSIDKNGEQIDQIKSLFFGKTKSYIVKDEKVRMKEEFFSDIKVDVASGPRDIYSALDGYFDEQIVDVEGAQAPQYGTISQLPPVLQIQIHRVQFDAEKKVSFKSNHHLELKETIFLDRYMDNDDAELMQRRQASWKWKARLRKLETRKAVLGDTKMHLDLPDLLDRTKEYLTSLRSIEDDDMIEVNPTVLSLVGDMAAEVRQELNDIETEIKDLTANISSQFTDLRNLPYRLQSVFIHRGSVSFGHYWIYIYDFAKCIWRKYNDSYVTQVRDREEILEQEAYNPATPYFLIYVKDEAKDELVDPVCRHLPEGFEEPPTEMAIMGPNGESTTASGSDANASIPWGGVFQGTTQSTASWDTRGSYNPDGW